jgi:glutamine amidotransferase
MTNHSSSFASVISREKIVGLQFHPEKSQAAGKTLIKNIVKGLIDA